MSATYLAPEQMLDEQDWEAFYREQFRLVYHYVYRKVDNRQEAEDHTSAIFLKAVRGLQQERGVQSMHHWRLCLTFRDAEMKEEVRVGSNRLLKATGR